MSLKERADRVQRRHAALAFPVAVLKKYSEDGSSNLATAIAFWAFFSIFPLFLVFVTVLGYVLPASDKTDVLTHVARLFPLLDPESVKGLSGSWWPFVVGGATALWSGLAVVKAVQFAFNSIWEIPEKDRPGMLEQVERGLLTLFTIGLGLVAATMLSGFVTGKDSGVNLGVAGHVAGYVIAIVLDVGLFAVAFRMLTDRRVSTRDVIPGALLAGVSFWVLQQVSSYIISRRLAGAQVTYGRFATVITILWWFYLQAQVTLLGAQLNVVLRERLYPRSIAGGSETDGDRRALAAYAEERTYSPEQEADTRFRRQRVRRRAS
jgi:membrane protein